MSKKEMKHKKTKMVYLGLREAKLATFSCPKCHRYIQFGDRKIVAYCYGNDEKFEE